MKRKLAAISLAVIVLGIGAGLAFLAFAEISVKQTETTRTISNERFF